MPELVVPADASRGERLAVRRGGGIGASEIAAVMGLSPWESEFGLYWRKVGVLDGDLDTERLEWGRRLEEPIARKFADEHPELLVESSGLYRSTVRPWQLATPDRELCDAESEDFAAVSVLECKSDNSFDGWGEHGSDEIPVYYRCQLLWQIDVLDLEVAYLACLFSGRVYREYVVERDDTDLQLLREAGERFWQRVQDEDPSDIDAHDATTAALKQLHPDLDDVVVDVPTDVATEYQAAVDAYRAAEQRKKAASNAMLAHVGTGRWAHADGEKVATRSVYDQHRLDADRLRRELPDLAEEYSTTSTVQKLIPAPAGKKTTTVREAVQP